MGLSVQRAGTHSINWTGSELVEGRTAIFSHTLMRARRILMPHGASLTRVSDYA
jgi:hypothetical protein